MQSNDSADTFYDSLRLLAAQNPRAARQQFEQLLNGGDIDLDYILTRMAVPGEGRLRQLIANFARLRADRHRFVKHFTNWLAVETDQFARRAIAAALDAPPTAPPKKPTERPLAARELVEMYRYVSERLRHELQNALLGPRARLLQLLETIKRLDEGVTRAELEALLARLRDEFQSLGRIAEFEPDDTYFALRPVGLCEWVQQMNAEYAKRYNRIEVRVDGSDAARKQQVLGSDYLLRLVFWNLWVNAHQAVGDPCTIMLRCDVQDATPLMVISDSGTGVPAEMVDVAFQDRYSPRGPNRGRGLLEVQDAIQQMHGDAQLVEVQRGEYRVQLRFPTKTA